MKILKEAADIGLFDKMENINGRSKYSTIDFYIMGKHSGKLRSGYGFEGIGIDPEKEEIAIRFSSQDFLFLPSSMTVTEERSTSPNNFSVVIDGKSFKIHITWSGIKY